MALNEEFLERLRYENDIESVVSSYVNLKRRGQTLVGLCPFHGEKTPSFTVYPGTRSFYCFGCASGGDVITFIRRIENLDYMEAVKFLADRASMTLPDEGYDDTLAKQRGRMYEVNRAAARFFNKVLTEGEDKTGLDYFRNQRHFSDKTIRQFGLGFAPASWHSLYDHLRKLGFSSEELLLANLIRKSEKNGRINYYDNFVNRAIVPIIDLRGNVIAFGGRVLDDSKPKYVNTSDTPVYKKSHGLFALNIAKNHAQEYLILVEGYMDVITLHQAGFKNSIACLGTALTSQQAQIISRYTGEVVLCYDSDEAGQKATQRALSIFKNTGLKVRVVTLSGGKDADEIINKYGAGRFAKLLEASANDTEYKLLQLRDAHPPTTSDGRVVFLKKACELLACLDSAIERDIYAGRLSQELDVSKKAILLEIDGESKKRNKFARHDIIKKQQNDIIGIGDKVNPEKSLYLRAAKAEEGLIAHLMMNNDRFEYITEKITPQDFVTSFNSRVFSSVCEHIKAHHSFDIGMLSQEFTPEEMGEIARIQASRSFANTKAECDDFIAVILSEKEKKDMPEPSSMSDSQFAKAFKNIKK